MSEWESALEVVVSRISRTGDHRYRTLCDESSPDHPYWRQKMIDLATGQPAEAPVYPSSATMIGNAMGALGRVVAAVSHGQAVRVSAEVLEERRRLCLACEFHDKAQNRCTKCVCGGLKLELSTERCPVGKRERIGPVQTVDTLASAGPPV